jgi:glycosyltransferase involved in cell wall biosynthesis
MVAAGAGPCVPADNPLALVHAIEDLAADPEGARALGRSGRKYRERVLSESAAIESFEAVLIAASKKQFAHPMETITRETSSASPVAYAA